ncbi:MAG: alpha/beta hydrolase [Planctomycetes bacterium]|nr:alpha/beta hydrolase [Planctomycetota bacterium]
MVCLFATIIAAPTGAAQEKLNRDQLLFYRDNAGKVQPVQTVADWEKRRASIHAAMQTIMGPMPGKEEKRCPLAMKIVEKVDCKTYERWLITYQSEPGMRVPAYLLVPKHLVSKKEKKVPPAAAVLSLHPTNAKGFRVTVGLADTMNREYGVELAELGHVVIATPYPQLSDYNPDLKKLGYQSGTMKAIWDNMRALDVLDSLPFVRKGRYAAIGHSLGGHNSVYTAAFDERVKIAVSCCGLDSYRDYMNGKIKGWTSDRYMPKLLDYEKKLDQIPFDFGEILGAIAPRHVFVVAPKMDSNFRWKSAAKVVKSAAEVYKLYGAEKSLRIAHPDCGHVFSPEMRQEAYKLIGAVLGN